MINILLLLPCFSKTSHTLGDHRNPLFSSLFSQNEAWEVFPVPEAVRSEPVNLYVLLPTLQCGPVPWWLDSQKTDTRLQ